MQRGVLLLGLCAVAGGCRTVDCSPKPPPPWTTPDGVEAKISDVRKEVGTGRAEKWGPYSAIKADLEVAFAEMDAVTKPVAVEVVIESYRVRTRDHGDKWDGIQRPGDPLMQAASVPLAVSSNMSSDDVDSSFLVQVGLMASSLPGIALGAYLNEKEAERDPEGVAKRQEMEKVEIGANVWLQATIRTKWLGGSRERTIVTRGFGDKEDDQRYWGDAIAVARDQAVENLGQEIRAAAKAGPTPP